MTTPTIHVGDVGVRLIVQFKERDNNNELQIVDVSAATTAKKICLVSPSVTKQFDATFFTNGTDGKIYYDTQAGDIDVAGSWRIAGRVESATYNYRSTSQVFTVATSICP